MCIDVIDGIYLKKTKQNYEYIFYLTSFPTCKFQNNPLMRRIMQYLDMLSKILINLCSRAVKNKMSMHSINYIWFNYSMPLVVIQFDNHIFYCFEQFLEVGLYFLSLKGTKCIEMLTTKYYEIQISQSFDSSSK